MMTFIEYINSPRLIQDMQADENLLGEIAEAVREAEYADAAHIGHRVKGIVASLHDVYMDEEEASNICMDCSGSGEGMHDGTKCRTCHGKGGK